MIKKCKHEFAYDKQKFWCIKCGHIEIRETPASDKPNPITTKKQGGTTYTEKDGYSDLKVVAPKFAVALKTTRTKHLAIMMSMEVLIRQFK